MNYHVDTRHRGRDLCKSIRCYALLSHFSSFLLLTDNLVLALILFLELPSLVLILKVVYQSHSLISEWHSVGEQVTWPEAQGPRLFLISHVVGSQPCFCEVSLNSIECCLRPAFLSSCPILSMAFKFIISLYGRLVWVWFQYWCRGWWVVSCLSCGFT